MSRRTLLTTVGVVVLALLSVTLVVVALRPGDAPQTTIPPNEIGTVAAYGDTVWRWVGPENCNADADVVQLERSQDGGAWTSTGIPLANVYDISFSDEDRGVATGTTSRCSRGVVVTVDGGRTWRGHPDNPVLLDAWFQGTTVWGVERTIGQPTLAAYRIVGRTRLVPARGVKPAQPCAASDGVADQTTFWSDTSGLLLCQNTVLGDRLIARTSNRARSFEALADDRPELGLDGPAAIVDLDAVGDGYVWALFEPGAGCREGDLRFSDSEGAVFERLPCASRSVRVQEVLDVSFVTRASGVMLALRDREPVMFRTTDGGRSWQPMPGQN